MREKRSKGSGEGRRAALEAEQGARRNAQALFSAEASRLRRIVADTEARLADLDRGFEALEAKLGRCGAQIERVRA